MKSLTRTLPGRFCAIACGLLSLIDLSAQSLDIAAAKNIEGLIDITIKAKTPSSIKLAQAWWKKDIDGYPARFDEAMLQLEKQQGKVTGTLNVSGDSLLAKVQRYSDATNRFRAEEEDFHKKVSNLKASIETFDKELTSMRTNAPVLRNSWNELKIGEFEEEAAFERRRNDARDQEQQEHERLTRDWSAQLTSLEQKTQIVRLDATRQLNQLRDEAIKWGDRCKAELEGASSLPRVVRTLDPNEVSLPVFNRQLMSFEEALIPPFGAREFRGSSAQGTVVRMAQPFPMIIQIRLSSLESAKTFKEKFESGEYLCTVSYRLKLVHRESPIVIEQELFENGKTLLTQENAKQVGSALFVTAVGELLGASPETIRKFNTPYTQLDAAPTRNVVRPERKIDGIRYTLTMTPESVRFVDNNGAFVTDAIVTIQ